LHIHITPGPLEVTIVSIQGEIDVTTAPTLKAAVCAQIDAGRVRLLLDLREVRYIDSCGLITLVVLLKRVREQGGGLVFLCDHPGILRVFRITGLANVFEVADGVHSGVGRLAAPPDRFGQASG
jgi:anti-sigma B factor antagonist